MKPTSLKQHNWRRLMALWYSMAHWRVLKTSLHNQYQYQCVSIESLAKHNCSWSRLSSNKAVDSQTTPMMQWRISKKFHHSIWYNFNEFHWWVQWTGKLLYATHQATATCPVGGWNCWFCWTWIFWVLYLFWFRWDVPLFVWLHYFKLGML